MHHIFSHMYHILFPFEKHTTLAFKRESTVPLCLQQHDAQYIYIFLVLNFFSSFLKEDKEQL